jgi:hypothetical protein
MTEKRMTGDEMKALFGRRARIRKGRDVNGEPQLLAGLAVTISDWGGMVGDFTVRLDPALTPQEIATRMLENARASRDEFSTAAERRYALAHICTESTARLYTDELDGYLELDAADLEVL